MSECDRFEMLISEYVDGELQEPEKTELELHLKRCSRCRRLCDAFRAISLSLGEEAAPAGFTAQVMAAVSTRGESGATMAKKPGKSWPKYLALAACLALAVLTTVRLATPSGDGGGGPAAAQPAQFGLAAAPREFDTDAPAGGSDAAASDSAPEGAENGVQEQSYGDASECKRMMEPEEVLSLRISGAVEAEITDAESIAVVADILRCTAEAGAEEPDCEASYLLDVEYEESSETILIWADDGGLVCSDGDGTAYSAAGSEAELLEAIG